MTEREVINGILNVDDTRSHCLAYVRNISNIDTTDMKVACKFVDIVNRHVDEEAGKLISSLRDDRLPDKFESSNLKKFSIDWAENEGVELEKHSEYLKQFSQHFYKYITKLIDRAMRKEECSPNAQILTEILQHLHLCNNSIQSFCGRQSQLERIIGYLKSKSSLPLVIHGIGGSGKTCLLAKVASFSTTLFDMDTRPIVILRFLGTTPESSSVGPLLTSICQQICYNYALSWDNIPDDHIPLMTYARSLLSNATDDQPLLIFLDSMEQLTGRNEANRLTWLPNNLPPNVKMVVSVLSGENSFDYKLLQQLVDHDQFVEVDPLGTDIALQLLTTWIENANRKLTTYQMKVVKGALNRCTLPIYVKLVLAEICRWKSYSKASETTLASNITDSIFRLFDRIEVQHGKTLVSHALAYITASRCGVSETELEDLISLDDKVLNDVYQYHLPPIRRIPPLLWTRIRNDLPNYLTVRDADSVSVLNWYHRQFREAAKERYFRNLNILSYFHSCLADYFMGTWGGGNPKPFIFTEIQRHRFNISDRDGLADRKVPLQPLIYYNRKKQVSRYNLRKFGELPYHLVRSNRFQDLFEQVLFNYAWLHSKLKVCPLQTILADFDDARSHLTNKQDIRHINLVADALRLSGSSLTYLPDMLAPQLLGRLLPMMYSHHLVTSLLQQCDDQSPSHCALMPCHHCLHTPGGPLSYSLEGQNFAVFGFRLTTDHRYVLSVSNKFVMWDLSTGEMTRNINPEIQGIMQDLFLSPDNKRAAAYTTSNQILILDMLTGQILKIANALHNSVKFQINKTESECKADILGMQLTNDELIIWTDNDWFIFCSKEGLLKRSILGRHPNSTILSIIYEDENNYNVITKDDLGLKLCSKINDVEWKPLEFFNSFVLSHNFDTLYTYVTKSGRTIAVLKQIDSGWNIKRCVPIMPSDEEVLSVMLCGASEDFVAVISYTGFYTWELAKDKILYLKLPEDVRNVSTKQTESQSSFVMTKSNQYAIAGVRKSLHVWELVSGQLLKTLDAHFGRILRIDTLCDDNNNAILSSSMDRSIKVWNIKNIFEQVHLIDKHELAISDLSVSTLYNIVITITRSFIGLWNLQTGELLAKLADSPIGAIISHAVIASDARFIVSVESEHIMTWKLETYQVTVISKKAHSDIKYLLMAKDNKLVIAISKERNKNRCIARKTITLNEVYNFTFQTKTLKPPVLTSDGVYIVFIVTEKNRDCIQARHTKTGNMLSKYIPKSKFFRDINKVIPFTEKPSQVLLISGERSLVVDIKNKKAIKTFKRLNGCITTDDRLGIFAPVRGGLELIDLEDGSTNQTLISKSAEGVFQTKIHFTKTDEYVIYYHSGWKTLRLFRVSDGSQLAEYKLPAELTCLGFSDDGDLIVTGAADGSLTILAIVDPTKPDHHRALIQNLPSRQQDCSKHKASGVTFKMAANMARLAVRTSKMVQSENLQVDADSSQTCSIS